MPRLRLARVSELGQPGDPLFVARIRHARVRIAVVDEHADLLDEVGVQGDAATTHSPQTAHCHWSLLVLLTGRSGLTAFQDEIS